MDRKSLESLILASFSEDEIAAAFGVELDEDGAAYILEITNDSDIRDFAIEHDLIADEIDYEAIRAKQDARDRAMARELNCKWA